MGFVTAGFFKLQINLSSLICKPPRIFPSSVSIFLNTFCVTSSIC